MHEPLIVAPERSGTPLDEFVALRWPRVAKGQLRRLIRDGLITLDGQAVQPGQRVRSGQVVLLEIEDPGWKELQPTAMELEILYQDEHLLAVNKPAGFPVEPSRWGEHPVTLSGALLAWAEERRGPDGLPAARPRALHRLDLGTTGVLLYALDLEAERYYRGLFESGLVEKTYHALVLGEVREAGVIEAALAADRREGGRVRIVSSGGKEARTEYAPLRRFRGYTLVEAWPRTGRTHQIRVHFASIGHPLVVDPRYGGRDRILLSELKSGYRPKPGREEKSLIEHLTLHAQALRCERFQGGELAIEASYPKDLRILLSKMEKWRRAPQTSTERFQGFRGPR